jgi:mannose-6-phosphate isomerase-like protein (cupin superfamily)
MKASWKIGTIPGILLTILLAACQGEYSLAQDNGSASASGAASPAIEHYSQADLLGLENKLEQKKDATGAASQTLHKYSVDYTMLSFRSQDGKAELHEKVADFFVVLEGTATLVTGGKIINGAPSAPGEVRGDSVQGGLQTQLKKGDIVHIPANTPHQLLVPKGGTFQYFIVKVQEVS